MTAASATPQQMRDRLLQAIDGQSNIRNMVAVLEVISYLEKYPITKEALEETRLGKLINDVRKKTKDEDLAKRAKKLLRNWQKLIEPGQSEVLSKGIPGAPGAPGSANGKTYPCRTEISPPAFTPTSKPVSELKCKNDIYNSRSPKTEKLGNRKRKGDQKDGLCLPTKISKTSAFERIQTATPSATNGIGGSAEPLSNSLDANLHSPLDRGRTEPIDNDKHSKIPVNAVKPHPSVPGLVKLPRTSSLLKTAVVQQHIMDEVTVEGGVPYPPKSPRCSSFSPRSMKQQALTNHPTTYAPKETVSSPYQSSRFPDGCASVPPSLPSPQPLVPPVEMSRADGPQFPKPKSSLISQGPAQVDQHILQSTKAVESSQDSTCSSKLSVCSLSTTPHEQGCSSEVAKVESDGTVSSSEGKRRKKYRPRDYTVNLIGQPTEDRTKPVRLKDRRLTFDPVTGQIKPLTHKEPYQEEEPVGTSSLGTHRTDLLKQKTIVPVQSPFQQTNWKELSRNEIIQSYLNLQSNVLTSSGAQTPGAQFFMKEYLKREEHHIKESRKTHVLVPNSAEADLPGVNREVTLEDLHRIHKEHWPGVNGCYDTKDNWFDWTQCISLDPHGDESKLNVLPYACLD